MTFTQLLKNIAVPVAFSGTNHVWPLSEAAMQGSECQGPSLPHIKELLYVFGLIFSYYEFF